MSKQSDSKKRQDYVSKLNAPTCSNCASYKYDIGVPVWAKASGKTPESNPEIAGPVNKRCGIRGFAIQLMGSCRLHKFSTQSAEIRDGDTTGHAQSAVVLTFDDGYYCAVATILNLHDEPVIAQDVLRQNYPTDLSKVNPDDLSVFKSAGILRG